MYSYIKGTLVAKKSEYCIVEASGIGYRIYTLPTIQDRIGLVEDTCQVFTYLYVREDTMALYGFSSQEEYDMFVLVLQVSGIGPKAALALVGQLSPGQFAMAVLSADIKVITQVKGIGKKGAERLILELKDKLKNVSLAQALGGQEASFMDTAEITLTGVKGEAINALLVLGYSLPEATLGVEKSYQADMTLETLIYQSLKQLV